MHAAAFLPRVSRAIRNQLNHVTEILDDSVSENAFKIDRRIDAEIGEVL